MAEFTLTGLRVLQEVAATGSFTAAAETLGYTQSAISRQIAAVEAAAGVALFDRGRRGVTLNAAGRVLARHAAGVLAGVEAAESELAGLRDRLAGRVSVGAFPTACAALLPRAVARMRAEHPGVEVTLSEASTPTLLRRLRGGRLEVAVVGVGQGLPAWDLGGLRQDALGEDVLLVAVPDGHRLGRQGPVGVADLRDEPWIVGEGNRGDPQFGAWPTLREPRIAYAVRSWPTRLGLVAAGLGLTVLPGLAVPGLPSGVRVVTVQDAGWRGRAAVAVSAPGRSPRAAALVSALTAEAAALRGSRR
ncbi:LysR family transcriptional regulator [Actinoplanes sp. URMC 104]|uniref:LysR family transcriptional regulator n=1 Tax=Actinoplanes sp. URMC 104 TaxID=3423409 RepID=UPI003F1B8FA9